MQRCFPIENLIKGDMAGTPSWKPKDKTRAGGHTSVSLQSLSSHLSFLSFGTGSVSDYDPRTGGNFRPFTLALGGMHARSGIACCQQRSHSDRRRRACSRMQGLKTVWTENPGVTEDLPRTIPAAPIASSVDRHQLEKQLLK